MTYPFEPYKIDRKYGDPATYGPHEGWDMNGLGGGNTDFGTPLKAVCDMKVVEVSQKTTGYGLFIVCETVGLGVVLYPRYSHLSEALVKAGDIVKEGQAIAKMGKTGNSPLSHLHFDVLKKKPSDWRFYAKTKGELEEYFLDPELFFKIPNMSTTEDRRGYWFDLINKVVWNKPWEQLGDEMIKTFVSEYPSQLKRSGYFDKVSIYLGYSDSNTITDKNIIDKIASLEKMVEASKNTLNAELAKAESNCQLKLNNTTSSLAIDFQKKEKQLRDEIKSLKESIENDTPKQPLPYKPRRGFYGKVVDFFDDLLGVK